MVLWSKHFPITFFLKKVAYGYELAPSGDYYVPLVEHAIEG